MKFFYSISISFLITFVLITPLHSSPKQIILAEKQVQNSVEQQLDKGRWELIMLWATYCHVCKKDFKKIEAFIKENESIPLTVVGVVIDGLEEKDKANQLIEKHKLNYTHVLTDYPGANEFYQTVANSELMGTPSYLLYDPENTLVAFNPNSIDLDALEILVYE